MRWICAVSILVVVVGCASLPPRYVEPSLPPDQMATVTADGTGIGIIRVDNAVACISAEYSKEGLQNFRPVPSVRLAPGLHELTFACWNASVALQASTNVVVEAGARYRARREFRGYSFSLSIERDQ